MNLVLVGHFANSAVIHRHSDFSCNSFNGMVSYKE